MYQSGHVLGCRRPEVVQEGVWVLEDVMDEYRILADCVIDLGRENTVVGAGAHVNVFPLLEHLS